MDVSLSIIVILIEFDVFMYGIIYRVFSLVDYSYNYGILDSIKVNDLLDLLQLPIEMSVI